MKHVLIQNIRNIDDLEVDISGPITIIAGQNGTGKTTVLETITKCLEMKGFTKEAIQIGKDEGRVVYVNQANGETQQVSMVVGQESTLVTMTITDATGKSRQVREVGEARRILGNYINFTPQDLVSMTQTAEGRRKFLMDVLFKSLPNETKARLILLENAISPRKNKDTLNNLYQQRTAIQADITSYEKTLENLPNPTDEEKELIENIEALKERKQQRVDELKKVEDLDRLHNDILLYIGTKVADFGDGIPAWLSFIHEKVLAVPKHTIEINDLREKILKADEFISNVNTLRSQHTSRVNITKGLVDQRGNYEIVEAKILTGKEEIDAIYRQADLPGGITIVVDEEDNVDFMVSNGKQQVSISQLSESQLHYIIIVLLMHISTAEMVNIGNISVYDSATLQKILDLAKQYDRILLAEKVTESEDLQIEIL